MPIAPFIPKPRPLWMPLRLVLDALETLESVLRNESRRRQVDRGVLRDVATNLRRIAQQLRGPADRRGQGFDHHIALVKPRQRGLGPIHAATVVGDMLVTECGKRFAKTRVRHVPGEVSCQRCAHYLR
jgi:hypothetical protein